MHSNVIAVNLGNYEIFYVRQLCNISFIEAMETGFPQNLNFRNDRKNAAQQFLQFDKHLACILAAEKADESFGRLFETLFHSLATVHCARFNERRHIGVEFGHLRIEIRI